MCEILGYIFGKLGSSEEVLKNVGKVLKNQTAVNRRIAYFALATTAYAAMSELRYREQNRRIEKLSKEIEELRCNDRLPNNFDS